MTTGPTQQAFATALAKDTGLSYQASLAWASAEVGPLNNLGIMNGSQPASFATPEAGAAAAAQLINSSPYYAGIRASTSGTVQQQLLAIAQSPWRLGPTGLAKAGGTDSYYVKVFSSFGLTAPAPINGGTTTSAPPAPKTAAPLATTPWTANDLAAGIGRYLAIPEGQRTPKQQQKLTTDIGTLVKDTGSPEAAAALIAQAMGGPVAPAPAPTAPVVASAPVAQAAPVYSPVPAIASTPIATVPSGVVSAANLPSPAANVAAAMNPAPSGGGLLSGVSPTTLLLIGAGFLVLVLVLNTEGGDS